MTCERNACREPAHWYVDGWAMCADHCLEALRLGHDEVTGIDGEPMMLDGDGEIARAS